MDFDSWQGRADSQPCGRCVGEMCTAKQKSVNTIIVAMANYQPPDEIFIEECDNNIRDLEVLAAACWSSA